MAGTEQLKFYRCSKCGNIVQAVNASGAPLTCCGEIMTELKANSTDAAQEKHVPVISVDGSNVTVKVGSAAHPMLPEHYIQWIYVQTASEGFFKYLKPGDAPEASFDLGSEKIIRAYAYCNLHGLWTAEA